MLRGYGKVCVHVVKISSVMARHDGSSNLELLSKGEINVIDSMRGVNSLQLSDVIGGVFDGFNLVGEIMLHKILHLGIVGFAGHFVQVDELVVHKLLQLQVQVHGVNGVAGAILHGELHLRHGNRLELHLAAAPVLVLDELLRVVALLGALLVEVVGKARQRDGVAIKVGPHGLVGVHGGVLDIDVSVDGVLLLGGVADVDARLDDGVRLRLRHEDEAGEVLARGFDVDLAKVDRRDVIGGHGRRARGAARRRAEHGGTGGARAPGERRRRRRREQGRRDEGSHDAGAAARARKKQRPVGAGAAAAMRDQIDMARMHASARQRPRARCNGGVSAEGARMLHAATCTVYSAAGTCAARDLNGTRRAETFRNVFEMFRRRALAHPMAPTARARARAVGCAHPPRRPPARRGGARRCGALLAVCRALRARRSIWHACDLPQLARRRAVRAQSAPAPTAAVLPPTLALPAAARRLKMAAALCFGAVALLSCLVSSACAQSRDSNCRDPVNPCNPNTNYFPQSERIEVEFASTISNVSYSDTFVDITATGVSTAHSLLYRIVRCGCPRPPDSARHIVLFTNPSSLSVHESPAIALLQALDPSLETLSYITSVDFVFSPQVRQKVASNEVQEAKEGFGTDFAALQADPDLSASIVGSFQFNDFRENTRGIPLLVVPDAIERSPLGRAEFIKVIGVFLGAAEQANSLFERIVTEYQDASRRASEAARRPSVLLNRPSLNSTRLDFLTEADLSLPVDAIYQWTLPHRDQYITNLLDDANADYVHERVVNDRNLEFPFSTVIEDFKFARFHLNVADFPVMRDRDTLEEYLDGLIEPDIPDPRAKDAMATLAAVRCDNVYNREKRASPDGRANDFFESAIIKPDEVLKDFVAILHPSVDFGDRELFYMGHYAASTDEYTSDCPFNDFEGPPPSSMIYVDNEFLVTERSRFDIERAWESDMQPRLKALPFDAEYDFLFEPANRADESGVVTETRFILRALTDPENEAQLKGNTEFREAIGSALGRDVAQLNADGSIIPLDTGLSSGAIAAIAIGSILGAALLVLCIFKLLQGQEGKEFEDHELSPDQFWGPPADHIEKDVQAEQLSRDQFSGPPAEQVENDVEAQELSRDQFAGLPANDEPAVDMSDNSKFI
ncbi:ferritin precursor [Gracilaria domingensis]|nr:ferritin precursor [Gracilaria domingensis]